MLLQIKSLIGVQHIYQSLVVSQRHIMDQATMVKAVRKCIPALDGTKHKGQAGRIGVVGGSIEYTGAPYYAATGALKVGADLAHIFCTSSAAFAIKTYSTELLVHPLLNESNAIVKISPWLDRLHAIVIGPGLGRETNTFHAVSEIIKTVKDRRVPLIIDADGLFLITEKPDLIKDFYSPVILTPNKIEYERLVKKVGLAGFSALGKNVTILKKGPTDELISSCADLQWKLSDGGSGRRCGGQGDLLSGSIATFLHWTLENIDKVDLKVENKQLAAASLSCYAASLLVRKCNEKAFKVKGRSMLCSDMMEYIHESFEELFGQ